jgi:hypothetical protein
MMVSSITMRRAGVTAFSAATLGSATRTLASRAASSSSSSSLAAHRRGTKPFVWGARYAACGSLGLLLGRHQSRNDDGGCLTSLRQSSTATAVSELEKTLTVTHPAYEVIRTDVVTEYGAYCTLFKHKKSGAELLSVSNDDDNKVSRVRQFISFSVPIHAACLLGTLHFH